MIHKMQEKQCIRPSVLLDPINASLSIEVNQYQHRKIVQGLMDPQCISPCMNLHNVFREQEPHYMYL